MRRALWCVWLAACGSSSIAGDEPDAGAGAGVDAAAVSSVDAPPGQQSCSTVAVGASLGRDRLMIGGAMDDATFAARPFDVRYVYLSGDTPAASGCGDCRACTVGGKSCANSGGGCNWWGCWQYDQEPPGRYAVNFIRGVRARGGIPMITYYVRLTVSGGQETGTELDALNDATRVRRYLADWRFLAARVKEATDDPVILHVEPDLWGYGQSRRGNDPTTIPVALAGADAACAGLPNHFGGLARCMVAIAAAVAPNARVALHVSPWAAQFDAFLDNGPSFDLLGHADRTAAYVNALGATGSPLWVVDMSDRDAGFNGRWWDATDATRPNFANPIAWARRVAQKLGKPFLWWQVPYGHVGHTVACVNGVGAYEDNRLDYVFDHPDRIAAGGALGVAFGAGTGCMTTAESDGGHFLARAATWFGGARVGLMCP
jgi:hypothetical protein